LERRGRSHPCGEEGLVDIHPSAMKSRGRGRRGVRERNRPPPVPFRMQGTVLGCQTTEGALKRHQSGRRKPAWRAVTQSWCRSRKITETGGCEGPPDYRKRGGVIKKEGPITHERKGEGIEGFLIEKRRNRSSSIISEGKGISAIGLSGESSVGLGGRVASS